MKKDYEKILKNLEKWIDKEIDKTYTAEDRDEFLRGFKFGPRNVQMKINEAKRV